MTKSEIPSRYAFTRPFADVGEKGTDFSDSSADSLSFPGGFSSDYAAPHSAGGKYVQRGNINRLGFLASNDLFYSKCGGINTFDDAFSAKVSGYPEGAILDYVVGNKVFKVKSLHDNNVVNFLVSGVDNTTHWKYMNQDEPEAPESSNVVLEEEFFHNSVRTETTATDWLTFKSEHTGVLNLRKSDDWTKTVSSAVYDAQTYNGIFVWGNAFLIKDLGTSISAYTIPSYNKSNGTWTLNDFSMLPIPGDEIGTCHWFNPGGPGAQPTVGVVRDAARLPFVVEAGHYYDLAFANGVYGFSTTIGTSAITIMSATIHGTLTITAL